jgi:hypothetical protein
MPPEHSRIFLDSCGQEWTVREIGSPTLSKALSRLLDKRRLSPYPPDWRSMSAFEIERWCMRAIAVPPAPERRAEDHGSPTA